MLQPLDPFLGLPHSEQHLLKGNALLPMLKFECHEPVHVRPSPSLLARIMQTKPQKECGDVLALGPVVFGRRIAGSHEIPHRLMTLVRYPDRGQLASPEELRKIDGVAPVGLHPVAGL